MRKKFKKIEKYTQEFTQNKELSFIKRSMWIDFDHRVSTIFDQYIQNKAIKTTFRGFHLARYPNKSVQENFYFQNLSQWQISKTISIYAFPLNIPITHGFSRSIPEKNQKILDGALPMSEYNAHIRFVQGIQGEVWVWFSPLKSDLLTFEHTSYNVGYFSDPLKLNEEKIEKIFENFTRYLSVTSCYHKKAWLSRIFLWKLEFFDLWIRKEKKKAFLMFLPTLISLILTVSGLFFAYKAIPTEQGMLSVTKEPSTINTKKTESLP